MSFPWPLERDACVGFTTWLTQVRHLRPSTAETYLAGITKAHEIRGMPPPPGLRQARICITGAEHLDLTAGSGPRPPRRAVTLPLLKIIGHKLAGMGWSEVDKQTVWTSCVLSFFTSARLGELLAASEDHFDPTATLVWADVRGDRDICREVEVDRQWQKFVELQQVCVRDQGNVHDECELHGFRVIQV